MEHADDTENAKGNRCKFPDSNPFRVLCVLRVQSSLHPLWTGRTVASFEARCLNEAQWQQIGGASSPMRKTIGDAGSLLLRQTDVSVAVARKPDRPWLRAVGDAIELIPGEHHAETRGYRLLKAGRPYADRPIRPGIGAFVE